MNKNLRLWPIAAATAVLFALVWLFALGGPLGTPSLAQGATPSPTAPAATVPLTNTATSGRAIVVIGQGAVDVVPNTAQVEIGVEARSTQIMSATTEANAVMEDVIAAVRATGVLTDDIQTAAFNVYVVRPGFEAPPSEQAEPIFVVENRARIIIRDMSQVSQVLSAAIDAGANQIFGFTLQVSEDRSAALQADLREQAIADARARAAAYAELIDAELGPVLSVSEVVGTSPLFRFEAQGLGGGGGVPISPGQNQLTMQVQVAFAIR